MSWSYNPSAWVAGVTIPTLADFQAIATDLHTRGGNVDAARYGRANSSFITLVPGAKQGVTYTVTAGSWSAGVATLTVGAHVVVVGQHVTAASVTPSGYNAADVVVTAVTGTTLSYALISNPGAYTSGGTVVVGGAAAEGMLVVDETGALMKYTSGSWVALSGTTTLSWSAPTLLNSWANVGGSYQVMQYSKDSFGLVHLRGVITGGTTTAATPLFVLPSGFRPPAIVGLSIVTGTPSACLITIDASGNVLVYGASTNLYIVGSFSV